MANRAPIPLITVACLTLLIYGCGEGQNGAGNSQMGTQVASYPVFTVEKRDVTMYKAYPTTLEGAVSSEVRPKFSGYIQSVLVKEGEQVTTGQPLFRIETQSLDQDAAAAKANVRAAQVEVDKTKTPC